MSGSYVPKALRERVAARAQHRCGYCLTQEAVVGTPMEIDHIIPESLGGLTEEENIWVACPLCNQHKGNRIAALDPAAEELPSDLAGAVSSLHLLSDGALWRAARNALPAETAARLEELHLNGQRQGLTAEESAEASAMVEEYERLMLVRASAIRLLKERGQDISTLQAGS